jgi:hypothetical protein
MGWPAVDGLQHVELLSSFYVSLDAAQNQIESWALHRIFPT